MDNAAVLLEFEKVVIYCPSALVCAYIIVQLYFLTLLLDYGYDHNPEKPSNFRQWLGFYVFAPTFLLDIGLVIYVTLASTRRSKTLSERDAELSSQMIVNHTRTPDPFGIELADVDDDDASTGKDDDNLLQKQDPTEITADEETRIMSMNISLIQKWLWTTPTFFFIACKISWDYGDDYSWGFVITPLTGYIAYYMVIALKMKNYTWQDQRDIDAAEKRDLRMEVIRREIVRSNAVARIKKNNKDQDSV